MLDTLILHPWLIALIWGAMYVFDYGSTVWLARAYQNTLNRYVVYEHGVELNPNLAKQIASGKLVSVRFVLMLAFVLAIILLSSLLLNFFLGYYFVEFLAGALLLTWSFVNSRHLRNYAFVWFLRRRPAAVGGRQEFSYWMMQKLLSAEALVWSLLFLLLFVLTWRIFFLAGTITCLSLSLRAYRLANRKFASSNGTPAAAGSKSDATRSNG
jgi:hypothetical protein